MTSSETKSVPAEAKAKGFIPSLLVRDQSLHRGHRNLCALFAMTMLLF